MIDSFNMFSVPTSTMPSILDYVAENLSSPTFLGIIIFIGAISITFFIIEIIVFSFRDRDVL